MNLTQFKKRELDNFMVIIYGIKYKEDTEFWLQKFKELKRRGIDKALYMVTCDEEQAKRAPKLHFKG